MMDSAPRFREGQRTSDASENNLKIAVDKNNRSPKITTIRVAYLNRDDNHGRL